MHQAELIKKLEHTIHNVNEQGLELIMCAIGNFEEIEKYNINTTKERLEQIKAEEEQEEAERQAKREAERRNKPNPYEVNETMKMLEHQCPFEIIGKQGFKEINNILEANPYTATQETAINLFTLGYIYGKRAERARRKNKKRNISKEDNHSKVWYVNMIMEMVKDLDMKFLRQIYIIIKTHIEKVKVKN